MEHHKLLPDSQFGFRKTKSCSDNLALLSTSIEKALLEGVHVSSLFLDIKSAYDNVLVDVLIERLKGIGLPNGILTFIYNLCSERNLHRRYGPIDEVCKCVRGLTQGGVLSPILYTLYINQMNQFADDIVIFSVNADPNQTLSSLEISANSINRYLCESGIDLSR